MALHKYKIWSCNMITYVKISISTIPGSPNGETLLGIFMNCHRQEPSSDEIWNSGRECEKWVSWWKLSVIFIKECYKSQKRGLRILEWKCMYMIWIAKHWFPSTPECWSSEFWWWRSNNIQVSSKMWYNMLLTSACSSQWNKQYQ